jgi:MoxR-like ATPase
MENDKPNTPPEENPPNQETTQANGPEILLRQHTDLSHLKIAVDKIKAEISKVIVGQEKFIELLLAALFTGGHALVEGVPGIAKTLTAKLLAQALDIDFSRIQFTPDLMPSDVVGTNVFNQKTSEFSFNPGPIFANVVLIDEINRSPAKTQAALFEVMEEMQVTVDGRTYPVDYPFFVVATQNPIEQEGTYKLPEAQLDRFLIKIEVAYPDLEEEKEILMRFQNDFGLSLRKHVHKVLGPQDLGRCRELVELVHLSVPLIEYIAAIVHRTRSHGDVYLGASPRASLSILKIAKALAAMQGRDFVIPEDIQSAAYPVLIHRLILQPEREIEGCEPRDVITDILQNLEVPR